jgi:3-oxoacyl-ACP reductase-like protein
MKGMVDLECVVVVAGFAEVGRWGNSRTRWEMEAFGEFSLEGCIEMAWIMGLIKNFNERLKDGISYSGWVDAKTERPEHSQRIYISHTILMDCSKRNFLVICTGYFTTSQTQQNCDVCPKSPSHGKINGRQR